MTGILAAGLAADQRLATVWTTQTWALLKIRPNKIAAAPVNFWLWDVVDDFEDVPNAPRDGQLDCNDDQEVKKRIHVADFTG